MSDFVVTHPYIHPFSRSLHFSIRIFIFHVVNFLLLQPAPSFNPSIFTVFPLYHLYFSVSTVDCVLLQPVWSIYPSFLAVCVLLYPCPHLSRDHICTYPVRTVYLSIHFHRLCTFPSIYHLSCGRRWTSPVGVSIYPPILVVFVPLHPYYHF